MEINRFRDAFVDQIEVKKMFEEWARKLGGRVKWKCLKLNERSRRRSDEI